MTRYAKGKELLNEKQKRQEQQLETRTDDVDEHDSKEDEENCIMEKLLELFKFCICKLCLLLTLLDIMLYEYATLRLFLCLNTS